MRIAVNARFLLKDKIEGIGRVSYELTKRMVEAHPEVDFIFCFDRPYHEDFIFGKNVTPIVVSPPARHPVLWYLWFEWSVPYILEKYKADLFFSPDGYCSLRSSVPNVMITHDLAHVHYPSEIPSLVRKYYDYFVPRYLKKADRIISVSHATKTDIVQQYGIDSDKIEVVHNGNRNGFKPLSPNEKAQVKIKQTDGKDYFLYVGAVHPRKNLDKLIEGFNFFKSNTDNDIQLLIGGRLAWQTEKVKNSFEQSPFKKDIQFLGFIPDEYLPKIMATALGFVYVSLFEGFGLPILEAMYTETPIITSNTSSLPEVAGDAALLVNPNEARSIGEAMMSLADTQNTGLKSRLIQKGRKQRALFDWDKAADAVYNIIEQTAQKV